MPTLHFQSLVTSLACYICEYLNFPLCSRKPQEKKIALLSVRVFGTAVANVERKLGIPTGGSLTGWQFTLHYTIFYCFIQGPFIKSLHKP